MIDFDRVEEISAPRDPAGEGPEKRNVVLGVSGSIAAYKAAELARMLVSWGYHVRVVMTDSAREFISPLTMGSITGHPVVTKFWDDAEISGIGHIQLADWADAVVIAPATADCIAKLANGFADTPLHAVCLATRAPLLIAPAMNVNMFEHPSTQENIDRLKQRGVHVVDPDEGDLACGWSGSGRLAAPHEIFNRVRRTLSYGDLRGKRILITTGPTREYIDPVRYLSNRSSGKMGIALVREAYRRGAEVLLVHGPVPVRVPRDIRCVHVVSAAEMHRAVLQLAFPNHQQFLPQFEPFGPAGAVVAVDPGWQPDIIIMSAAVADFRPETMAENKIKKGQGMPGIKLVKNPDILNELGALRAKIAEAGHSVPHLVGFAVETGDLETLLAEAHSKLKIKNADLIVGNFAEDAFDLDTNRAWLIDRHGRQEEVATSFKSRVANRVLDAVLRL